MSTWGQINLLLTKSSPGVDAELLIGWLNSRYEQLLEAADWEGVKQPATVETIAAIQSGISPGATNASATFTNGSTAVTFAGTPQPDATWIGRKIYRVGDTVTYVIQDASGTLDRGFEALGTDPPGTVYAAAAYVVMQDIYPLPANTRTLVKGSVLSPVNGTPMTQLSRIGLANSAGIANLVGDPEIFVVYGDDSDSNPILHQVQFYPPPVRARGIPFEYVLAGVGFDGTNTGDSPLPFISDTALREGVEADSCLYLAKQNPAQAAAFMALAKGHESKFQEERGALLRIEFQQRRPQTTLQMAPRFTRHRIARALRGRSTSWRGGQPGGPV